MPPTHIRLPRWDTGFLALFLFLYAWLLLFTIPEYGIMWDAWEYHLGDRNLRFWQTLEPAALDPRRDDWALYHSFGHPNFHAITNAYQDSDALLYPHLIWPLGPLSSSLSKLFLHRGFGVDPYDAHHAILVPWMLLLLVSLWALVRPRFGRWPAVTALLVVAIYPRLWAEAHNNIKDIPSAALITATLAIGVAAVERRSWRRLLLSGLVWGLALAAKPNGFFLPFIGVAWLVAELYRQRQAQQAATPLLPLPPLPPLATPADAAAPPAPPVLAPAPSPALLPALALAPPVMPKWFWPLLLALPIVALLSMLAVWPLLWGQFPAQFLLYLQSLMERGYAGASYWQFIPVVHAVVTMPFPILVLVLLGLIAGWRDWRRGTWRPLHWLALAWLLVPVARVSLPGARDFDVIRHWLEFVPAVGIWAGLGVHAIRLWWRRRPWPILFILPAWARPHLPLLLLLLWLSPVLLWNYRAHPHELVFYNSLVGGLPGARLRGLPDTTDYWASSYRRGFEWLNQNAPRQELVLVGVAEHLAAYTQQIWLRGDLTWLPVAHAGTLGGAELTRRWPNGAFVMYVTREPWYPSWLAPLDRELTPVYQIQVEGADILRILRLDAATLARLASPPTREP